MNDTLRQKLREAPKAPGCYLFYDDAGRIIYVGKAKVLASRVRTYFHASAREDERIRLLAQKIQDVDFQVAPSETDALLQEYRLIKRHKPWFNSQMKRDTKRPFIRIDVASEYPSISIAEEAGNDGAEYFGSFSDMYDAEETIQELSNVWRTQLCMRATLPARDCLFHALNRCAAPCVKGMESAAYRSVIQEVTGLLRGEHPKKAMEIKREMEGHISSLAFEKAAASQEKLWALERLRRMCQKICRLHDGQNAIVLLRAYRARECILFTVRCGAVVNRAYISGDFSREDRMRLIRDGLRVDPAVASQAWLAPCVTEVFADKAFLRVPDGQPTEETARAVAEQVDGMLEIFP